MSNKRKPLSLREYLNHLKGFVENNPEALEEVCYIITTGDQAVPVHYSPDWFEHPEEDGKMIVCLN